MLRTLTTTVLLVALLMGSAWTAPASGGTPYDFELYDLEDRLYDLSEVRTDEASRLVVVDFFQVDCAPCKKALPKWVATHKSLHDSGLRIVVVAVPGTDTPGEARGRLAAWFEKNPVPFPVVFDKYGEVARRYGVAKEGSVQVPQVFVLDRDGALLTRTDTHAVARKAIQGRLIAR